MRRANIRLKCAVIGLQLLVCGLMVLRKIWRCPLFGENEKPFDSLSIAPLPTFWHLWQICVLTEFRGTAVSLQPIWTAIQTPFILGLAFKVDHLKPVEQILSQNFFKF